MIEVSTGLQKTVKKHTYVEQVYRKHDFLILIFIVRDTLVQVTVKGALHEKQPSNTNQKKQDIERAAENIWVRLFYGLPDYVDPLSFCWTGTA